jgi:uncharacterized protein YndB with AHSA1/START domain
MNDRATLIDPSTIRFERLLPGPVERVWAYLTESNKRALWLAAGEFDLRVGGKVELLFDNSRITDEAPPAGAHGAAPHRAEGVITRLEPMKLLAHTWVWESGTTEVTYELEPRGKDVLLTIHHKLPDGAGANIAVGGGWAAHVGILEDQLRGVKPRPFFSTHAREMKAFEDSLAA